MGTAHRYSDSELESMLQDVESDLVERKESLRGDVPTGIREAVCALQDERILNEKRRHPIRDLRRTDVRLPRRMSGNFRVDRLS